MEIGSKCIQRGKSFAIEEDKVLCMAWLEISQDPIQGINQKKDKLWERITMAFHNNRPSHYTGVRTVKSLQCRMTAIMKAINKFRGCVRSVDRLNPSGSSEVDILEKAKMLFAQDADEKKGFQFDHVWPILKEAEKWLDNIPKETQQSQGGMDISPPTAATENLEAKVDYEVDSYGRPTGRKKEKVRKRLVAEKNFVLDSIVESNKEIIQNIQRGQQQRQEMPAKMESDSGRNYQLLMLQAANEQAKLQLERERQEKEIMEKDLNSIEDLTDREYFRRKKMEILERQAQVASNSSTHGEFTSFNQYESAGLPEY